MKHKLGIRLFVLVRDVDVSGVSGTGIVAEGVEFSKGVCALWWLKSPCSVGIFQSVTELLNVHGHNGKTHIQWLKPGEEL